MKKTYQTKDKSSSRSKNVHPTLGVLTPGFADRLFLTRIVEAARQRGVRLIGFAGGILGSHGFEAQANLVFDLVNPAALDGLIVNSDMLCHYVGIPALRAFCARYPLPMVSNGVALPGIPGVRLDYAQGIRAVLAHLIEAHHCRRIAFIRGPVSSLTGEERYLAYQEALAAYDIPFDPQLVASGTFYAPSGAEAVRLLFDERGLKLDALAAANDFMALDAMHTLAARGVRIPEDLAVVGFDDMEEAAFVDGCGQLRMFWRIIFPLLKLITASVIIINCISIWNDFFVALLFLSKKAVRTLPMSIFAFIGQYNAGVKPRREAASA